MGSASTTQCALDDLSAVEAYILEAISSAKFDGMVWWNLNQNFPNLTKLEVEVNPLSFTNFFPSKSPWEDDLTDAELASCMDAFLSLRGIQHLTWRWSSCYGQDRREVEELENMKRFKIRVESLIHDIICQPSNRLRPNITAQSFEDALRKGRGRASNVFEPCGPSADNARAEIPALSNDELPKTEAELVRTVFSKPEALFKWIEQAKEKLKIAQ